MIQDEKSATLSCNNDQTLFAPTYSLDRAFYNQGKNAAYKPQIDEEVTQTVVAKGPNAVACIQGSMIGRSEQNGPQGSGINDDVSFTLNTTDRHGVVYGISAKDSNAMKSDNPHSGIYEADTSRTLDINGGNPGCNQGGMAIVETEKSYGFYPQMKAESQSIAEEKANCIVNGTNPGFHNGVIQKYIVRRLTPTECARLQGFPDWWCDDLGTEEPTDEDMSFWRDVFDTYARISGTKPKSDNQIKKWLKSPHTDSAEYKMWGNGVALPCVYFVLAGIEWAESEDQQHE